MKTEFILNMRQNFKTGLNSFSLGEEENSQCFRLNILIELNEYFVIFFCTLGKHNFNHFIITIIFRGTQRPGCLCRNNWPCWLRSWSWFLQEQRDRRCLVECRSTRCKVPSPVPEMFPRKLLLGVGVRCLTVVAISLSLHSEIKITIKN